ncbi:MAG: transporter substrate-binding domain-containing protein [Legionella sp.]|nr:MAG: transporter substrate-binding domain-containing protein [Legionella sp.]
MNICLRVFVFFTCFSSLVYAVGEPLNIGVTNFTPPFIMHDADKKSYGFDIDMMNYICKVMQRTCVYKIMSFDELIPAVANNSIDVAVSSLTITAERTKMVNFSLPYLLSYSRFLAKRSNVTTPFSLSLINGKRIGVRTGTVFGDQIKHLGIKDAVISEYSQIEELLEALSADKVDFVLLDSPTTNYWEANSSSAFMKVGPAYMYGYGLGIATTPINLPAINRALLQYQASPEYKINFDKYIIEF